MTCSDVFYGTPDGYDIVTLEVLGGSAVLPLGKIAYDSEADTLTLGETTDDPGRIFENADFVGYWAVTPKFPGKRMDPIGVSLRRTSVHLAPTLRDFEAAQQ